jgi:serine/threonine-protein kinase RsbT
MESETCVRIGHEADIVSARRQGRELAARGGFSGTEQTLIATAISEVARNIVEYAEQGEIVLSAVEREGRRGITVIARDTGPGIPDLELVMRDGYSTSRSLGMGLPGVKRLMDEFTLISTPGEGTTVTMTKWVR